jgi:uncharacterized membrane-anchored protein YjiN (DUF445 family)
MSKLNYDPIDTLEDFMIYNKVFNKVVNDILLQVKPVYLRKQIATELLDLITRLQEEKARPKKILANRVYADATLMSMTKAELIEHIRILEHNWSAAEETLANSVKNSEQIFYEQKEEIERLKKDLEQIALCNKGLQDGINEYQVDNAEMRRRNAELQKQLDELMNKLGKVLSTVGLDEYQQSKAVEQATKDVVKDLLIEFNEWINEHYDAKYDVYCVCIPVDKVGEFLTGKAKEYGIEG